MQLTTISETPSSPERFLNQVGRVFAKFDEHTQDSGNVSYGVEAEDTRFFVKTAGVPTGEAFLTHDERVFWLRNAARLSGVFRDPALPCLLNLIESSQGPMLVYEWVDGDLIGVPRQERSNPDSAFFRFKLLPLCELGTALTSLFGVHAELCARGWIACDFYDGAMIYDFDRGRLSLIDLDMYRDAPFVNEMGRMFGSTRFMAPEEFERGATIDESTTVFTMGRCVDVFLGERIEQESASALQPLLEVGKRACHLERAKRWPSMQEFYGAWLRSMTLADPIERHCGSE